MGLPPNLARGPSVVISDVSRDLKTVDDMRSELTEYAIFRFEKMQVQNRYDDDGTPPVSSWEQAIRTQVLGMSLRETARQIQRLNRDTRPLADKLKTISPVLQRQIDAAQLTLQNPDSMNYEWNFTQIDHQLREVDPYAAARENHPSHGKHHGSTKKRYHSRTSGHRRKSYERISLTAYFKRTPKPNVDIPALYEAKKKLSFPNNSHSAHPSTSNDLRPPPVGPRPTGGAAPVGPNGAHSAVSPPAAHPGKLGPGEGGNLARNVAFGNGQNREEAFRNHNTMRRELGYSDGSSSDESFDTQATPATSISSGSFNNYENHRRHPGDDWIRAGNGNGRRDENEQGRNPPRHHAIPEQQYSPKNEPRLSSTPGRHPPLPRVSGITIDRVRDDAYLVGIRDGRGDAWLAQQRALQEAQRLRPKPRIIQEVRPLNRRHMSHPEPERFDRREYLDDEINRFNRLSLDAEDGYDAMFRRADARRRREFEYLLQRGSVLDDDPFDKGTFSYAREGRRRYREPYVTDDSDTDLSPSPRGGRSFRY